MATIDKRVLANGLVSVFIGPETAIADYTQPTLAELQSLTNVSGAVNWDSFDFNVQASGTADDRTLTDAAGAKSRQTANFGGNIEFVTPQPTDTTSIYRTAYSILSGDRPRLAVVIRVNKSNGLPIAAGDVLNAYHVLADAHSIVRASQNKPSYGYKVNFTPQNDLGINRIAPASTATAVTLSPSTLSVTSGSVKFLKATYQGVNVTIGAQYTSSDPTKAVVTEHGAVIAIAAGSTNITATYPGSLASTAVAVTVS